ncbi:uncharacterized, partial [Tachysurus ichikawai]
GQCFWSGWMMNIISRPVFLFNACQNDGKDFFSSTLSMSQSCHRSAINGENCFAPPHSAALTGSTLNIRPPKNGLALTQRRLLPIRAAYKRNGESEISQT